VAVRIATDPDLMCQMTLSNGSLFDLPRAFRGRRKRLI
jgi:hypothetical protein